MLLWLPVPIVHRSLRSSKCVGPWRQLQQVFNLLHLNPAVPPDRGPAGAAAFPGAEEVVLSRDNVVGCKCGVQTARARAHTSLCMRMHTQVRVCVCECGHLTRGSSRVPNRHWRSLGYCDEARCVGASWGGYQGDIHRAGSPLQGL
jgi:hypothetical protein